MLSKNTDHSLLTPQAGCRRRSLSRLSCLAGVAGVAALLPFVASAHHPMDFALVGDWGDGLLSGIGHPFLGLDHLVFMLALSFLLVSRGRLARTGTTTDSAAASGENPAQGRRTLTPTHRTGLVALLIMLLGVGVALAGVALPVPDLFVAASVVIFGVVMASSTSIRVMDGVIYVAMGFHGYAYGLSVVGAEATPILWYLVGLTVAYLFVFGAMVSLISRLPRVATFRRQVGVTSGVAGGLLLALGASTAWAHTTASAHVHANGNAAENAFSVASLDGSFVALATVIGVTLVAVSFSGYRMLRRGTKSPS
ncbi:MAG: HupE/UreJ family protein [Alphaproteobacteria bacterium]|nr:HupE/UreJ family protein [Alphaproteobacteria bacterium]